MRTPPRLWHYTCRHALEPLRAELLLRPNAHPLLPRPVAWLTDLETPDRTALGLTSGLLACDRLEVAVLVEAADAAWWPDYRQHLRPRLPARAVRLLEDGRRPASWWVAEAPLEVVDVVERVPA